MKFHFTAQRSVWKSLIKIFFHFEPLEGLVDSVLFDLCKQVPFGLNFFVPYLEVKRITKRRSLDLLFFPLLFLLYEVTIDVISQALSIF